MTQQDPDEIPEPVLITCTMCSMTYPRDERPYHVAWHERQDTEA